MWSCSALCGFWLGFAHFACAPIRVEVDRTTLLSRAREGEVTSPQPLLVAVWSAISGLETLIPLEILRPKSHVQIKPRLAWRRSCSPLVQQSVTPPLSSSLGPLQQDCRRSSLMQQQHDRSSPPVIQQMRSTLGVILQALPLHTSLLKSNSIAKNPNKCQYPAGSSGRPCARDT